ncbi:homoserine O-acetyltransferase MetA [Scatolibacter rhodanostii]|uniref:homoserine O-acetyltransferase MetA n=1 Tax=Scatolibacter rhodanostii TaxID=2014781 RepID=UPI000C082093|nr:homoserine O-succinyltransferase [Scatolibacter rhodanostii]
MPIKIQTDLPAIEVLESENIFVMTHERAALQDIRPLKIVILNLMPTKIETETQLLRLLSNSPLQIEVDFIHPTTHISKNTSASHLNTFYHSFEDVRQNRYDGMIVTGAPIEQMPFEEVDYWHEMTEIMEWSKTNVYSVLYICWGAQAGLYYHHGIKKYPLSQKLSGIYNHTVLNPYHPLMRGFDDNYFAPHSRHTEVRLSDVTKDSDLIPLAVSDLAGLHIVAEKNGRAFYVTGHAEYDRDTLAKEYFRDVNKGLNPSIPYNYFPDNDHTKTPPFTWRSNAHLLLSNWLNYYVYQRTPYHFTDISHTISPEEFTYEI